MNDMKTWNWISVLAVIALAGALAYDKLVPTPAARITTTKQKQAKLQDEAIKIAGEVKTLEAANKPRLWLATADELQTQAMARVSNTARANGLSMISFRPQKMVESGELERYRYVMTLEGAFPKVIDFMRQLETPTSRLAVDTLQMASKDGASDLVSANIGVVAYREKTVEPKPGVKKK